METAVRELPQGKKHPKGLYLLFFTELWERYSYFGMRSILVLYLTAALISGGLGMSPQSAMLIYGIFTGGVYFTPIIGGFIADKFIGLRAAITVGGITIALANFVLFLLQSQTGLYLGLALLIIGNGFLNPICQHFLVNSTIKMTNVKMLRLQFFTWVLISVPFSHL